MTGEVCFAASAVGDRASGNGEKGVVATDTDILTSLYLGAALTNDNHTRTRSGAVSELHPEIFRV